MRFMIPTVEVCFMATRMDGTMLDSAVIEKDYQDLVSLSNCAQCSMEMGRDGLVSLIDVTSPQC